MISAAWMHDLEQSAQMERIRARVLRWGYQKKQPHDYSEQVIVLGNGKIKIIRHKRAK